MDPTPSPTVINVDFQAKPADAVGGPFPPDLPPARPVPFRKRTSFLPVRFFSAKRLPPGASPEAGPDEPSEVANVSPEAAAAGAPARLLLPPLPEEIPAAPVEPAPVQAAELPDPLPMPEAVPPPVAVVTPERAGELPEAASEPPPGVPADLTQLPTPAAKAAPRSDARGATVQLTLGCEVAALRLTPAFRLGSVQLRTLSDVVALRFIAPGEAGNPLAAAVACQIVHVELDPVSGRLKNLLLKPLDEPRDSLPPHPRLQVAELGLARGEDDGDRHAPITVTAAPQTSTTVQLFGTFTLGSIHFTPAFGVGTLRLEAASDTVLVRLTPSTLPTARDLPPSFDLTGAELDADGRLAGLWLTPGRG